MNRKHKERHKEGHFGGGRLEIDFGDTIIVHAISRGTRYKPQFSPSALLFLFHRNALFSSTTKEVGGDDNDDDDDTIIETRTKKMMETFHPLMRHIFASSKCASCVHAIDFSSNINNNNKIEDDVDGRKKTSKQLHNVLKRINAKDRAISIAFGSKESLIVLNALMQHDKMESVMSVVLMNPIPTNDDASSSSSSSREFAKACEEIREGAIGTVKIFVVLSSRGEEYVRERERIERIFVESASRNEDVSVLVKGEGAKLGEAVADAVRERDASGSTIHGLSNRVDEWILETEKASENYAELFVSKITFEHNKYDKQIEQVCVECTERYSEALGNKEREIKLAEVEEEEEDEEEPPPVVYLARRPFDSRKLFLMLRKEYGKVSFTEDLDLDDDDNNNKDEINATATLLSSSLRSQGVVWVNSRLTTPLQWLHKHSEPVRVYAVNEKPWFKDDADEDDDEQKRKQLLFRRSFSLCGDRRNHLVFEGVKDAEKLRETLDACLCEYDTAFDGDDFCEKKEEANFFIACQQVWESVPDTMERCGVIAEGRGGAGCVALMQQKERVFLKDKTSSSLLSQDKLSAKEDVEEKEEQKEGKKLLPLGGKIGVRVPEAFLRPTKQQGETKVFSNNRNLTGHYFPKMPCLACGSPWWIGDGGWNSTCANCGEDDRCYGLDQMPLRQFRGKHRTFCEMVLSMDVCRDD